MCHSTYMNRNFLVCDLLWQTLCCMFLELYEEVLLLVILYQLCGALIHAQIKGTTTITISLLTMTSLLSSAGE